MCQAAVEGCSGVKLAVMNYSGQGGGGGEARQAEPSGLVIVQVDVIKRHYHI